MAIYNYTGFLNESTNIQFFISQKLEKILKHINDPISNAILLAETEKKEYDITYLDCTSGDKNKIDRISFLPSAKVEVGNIHDPNWTAKSRQEMAVGRVVNRLFPNTFSNAQVEQFVNAFKAKMSESVSNFRLVDGEDIRKYYLVDNYEEKNRGDINNSCMNNKESQPFLNIYVENPEKCKLLVLMSDKYPDKIKGRALVWMGLRKPIGKVYLDRIYTVNDSDEELYKNYAAERGWLYKNRQIMNDVSYVEDGKVINSSVAIVLNPAKYKQYPSLDTLSYYTPSTGRLGSNAGNYIKGHPRIRLDSAGGGYSKIDRE